MKQITIKTTRKDEVIDITEAIKEVLQTNDKANGVCLIHAMHTTCCITTADLDPGTDQDITDGLRSLLDKNLKYRHPHDPSHAPDHIISAIVGPSVSIPFENKKLLLGTWQRIILIELDGPRERKVVISCLSE